MCAASSMTTQNALFEKHLQLFVKSFLNIHFYLSVISQRIHLSTLSSPL